MSEVGRLLLVDDSPRDTELILDALAEFHLANDIVCLRDGVEVLDYLYRRAEFAERPPGDPAVILLDLKMPRIDGLEVLRQVKADPQLKRLPIVVMTSSREERDLVTSYELGVNAYVVKPLDFAQFTQAIRAVGAFWAVVNHPPPARLTPTVGSH